MSPAHFLGRQLTIQPQDHLFRHLGEGHATAGDYSGACAVEVDGMGPVFVLDNLDKLWLFRVARWGCGLRDGTPDSIHEGHAFRNGVRPHRESDTLALLEPEPSNDAAVTGEAIRKQIGESFRFRYRLDLLVVESRGPAPPPVPLKSIYPSAATRIRTSCVI